LAGWIAGLKENFLPTVFWFSVSAVVGSISIPMIFQLEYPFPNFSDLVMFSNLMFACRRSGFTKPGFSILRVFCQNMKWNLVFPVLFSFNLGPPWSCKLQAWRFCEKSMVNLAFSEPSQDEQEQKHFEFLNMAYHSST